MRQALCFLSFLIISQIIYGAATDGETTGRRPPLNSLNLSRSSSGGGLRGSAPSTPTQTGQALRDSTSEWDGNFYEKHGGFQEKWAEHTLNQHVVSQDANVLDVGCGNGRVTAEVIAKRVQDGTVVGVDPSPEMIKVAKGREIPGVLDFREGSAEGTGFAPETFDMVTSFSTLHWVHDKAAAFKEIAKVLKPGGLLYVYMWVRDGKDPIRKAFEEAARSERWFDRLRERFFPGAVEGAQGEFKEPYHMTRRRDIRKLLEKNNFEIPVWQPHMSDERFENVDDFKNWLLGWSQFGCLGDSHENFILDVITNYRRITDQEAEGNPITYHDAKLIFVAQKKTES